MSTLLDVEDLRVTYPTRTGVIEAVRGVSFQLGRERLGIVGESGSGKSQTGRAIMGLTPPQAQVSAKKLAFDGIDLIAASPRERRALRGNRIAMILQDPKYSLDPVMSIGRQIVETLRAHERVSKAEARERALAMLEAVQIRDPARVFDLHPHEVSGGMGQRAMIAMMLIAGPELMIADEPTCGSSRPSATGSSSCMPARWSSRSRHPSFATRSIPIRAACSTACPGSTPTAIRCRCSTASRSGRHDGGARDRPS